MEWKTSRCPGTSKKVERYKGPWAATSSVARWRIIPLGQKLSTQSRPAQRREVSKVDFEWDAFLDLERDQEPQRLVQTLVSKDQVLAVCRVLVGLPSHVGLESLPLV